jgi:hypothetical protein
MFFKSSVTLKDGTLLLFQQRFSPASLAACLSSLYIGATYLKRHHFVRKKILRTLALTNKGGHIRGYYLFTREITRFLGPFRILWFLCQSLSMKCVVYSFYIFSMQGRDLGLV